MAFDLETSPAPGLAHPSEPARAEPAGGDAKSVPPAGRRRLSKRARILLVVALAVLLLGGAGTAYLLTRDDDSTGVTYRTQTIATSTLKSTVSATGTLDPAREADLSFAQSGTVTSVKVAVGDTVTKGQVLATIGDDELQIDYTEARATLSEAKADLADLDDAATDTEIAAAKATVRSDRAAVRTAKAALADATLRATFSGLVADVGISKGDSTGSGSGGSGGTSTSSSSSSSSAITVISQGTFTVTTAVSTSDVGSVKKGLQAVITPTGATDDVYGTVSSVGVVASDSSDSSTGSATFPVTIKVTGTHPKLLPGSSASVEMVVEQLTDVIAVPTQAVTTADDKTVVQCLVDGKQVATEVTLGQTLGNQTVVTKGLSVGDRVVVATFTTAQSSGNSDNQQQQGGMGQNGGMGQPPDMGSGNGPQGGSQQQGGR